MSRLDKSDANEKSLNERSILMTFASGLLLGGCATWWVLVPGLTEPLICITGKLELDTATHDPDNEPADLTYLSRPIVSDGIVYLNFEKHRNAKLAYWREATVTGHVRAIKSKTGFVTELMVEKIKYVDGRPNETQNE